MVWATSAGSSKLSARAWQDTRTRATQAEQSPDAGGGSIRRGRRHSIFHSASLRVFALLSTGKTPSSVLASFTNHEARDTLPPRRPHARFRHQCPCCSSLPDQFLRLQQHGARSKSFRPQRARKHLHPAHESDHRTFWKSASPFSRGPTRWLDSLTLQGPPASSTRSSTSPAKAITSSPPATSTVAPTPSSMTSSLPSASRSVSSTPRTLPTLPPRPMPGPVPSLSRPFQIPPLRSPTSMPSAPMQPNLGSPSSSTIPSPPPTSTNRFRTELTSSSTR